MPIVLDQVDDRNHQDLHQFSRVYSLPEYVKQASTSQTCEVQPDLPSTAFADMSRRKFPCHTKAACYISTMFFLEKRGGLHPNTVAQVAQRLQKFANHWGIQKDVSDLMVKHSQHHTTSLDSLPDSSFALVWAGDDGSKERRYPLRNSMEVKVAATWFDQYRDRFIFADRQRMAEKILEKAAEFGAGLSEDLDDMLEKQAGHGVYDPVEAAQMIRDRSKIITASAEVKEGFVKLAQQVETNPLLAEDLTTTANLAATIDQLDRTFGLVGKYSAKIPRPEDVLFKGTLKTARAWVKNACVTLTGAIYEKSQFAKLSVAHIHDLLGDDIARAVTSGIRVDPEKMAEVASTLPLGDAVVLDRIMASIGQAPAPKSAAARGMTTEERQKQAQQYQRLQGLPDPRDLEQPTGVTGSRVVNA